MHCPCSSATRTPVTSSSAPLRMGWEGRGRTADSARERGAERGRRSMAGSRGWRIGGKCMEEERRRGLTSSAPPRGRALAAERAAAAADDDAVAMPPSSRTGLTNRQSHSSAAHRRRCAETVVWVHGVSTADCERWSGRAQPTGHAPPPRPRAMAREPNAELKCTELRQLARCAPSSCSPPLHSLAAHCRRRCAHSTPLPLRSFKSSEPCTAWPSRVVDTSRS